MKKKMIKHGNSTAIVIDKPILDLLNISSDTTFEITTDGRNLILSPQNAIFEEKDIIDSLQKINKKYQTALKRLSE